MKPCEPDSSPETDQANQHNPELKSWRGEVHAALSQADRPRLAQLFAELKDLVPPDQVSHIWLTQMSGWDARAKTG